jgi:hypothetical protein
MDMIRMLFNANTTVQSCKLKANAVFAKQQKSLPIRKIIVRPMQNSPR